MSKHTPGPWKVENRSLNFIDITHSQLNVPGAITHALCRVQARKSWIDEATANASLIAAAPDLLAALESAWQWMEGQAEGKSKGGHATFDLMMLREQRDIARAAIDKATGEA